ncbi:MAG TPA: hypothetical protein VMG82_18885 [Candidatus Sulfotelmatobacter sp.]|nr:hypothetical protein [Candidatus Sulfotelmatobacter sp.]
MTTGTKKRRVFEGEQDLLDFTRSYLSEDFPNPERKGCPPDDALRVLASAPIQGDKSVSDHLTCCSPCFNAYMAHIAHVRAQEAQSQRIRRATWIRRSLVTAGVAVMLIVAVYLFFTRLHGDPTVAPRTPAPIGNHGLPDPVPATAVYVPVLVDLSNASPVRGRGRSKAGPSPQVIPSSPLIDFTLQLPLASEARRYLVMLKSNRHVVWSDSAQAHLENGQTLLHMHADFRHVLVGSYDLVVTAEGFRVTVPVIVKITSSGRTQ